MEELDWTNKLEDHQQAKEKLADEEQDVRHEKQKVSFSLGSTDGGDDSSTCSDKSFEVDMDDLAAGAKLSRCGGETDMLHRTRKHGKRRQKGGIRHRRHQTCKPVKDNVEMNISQKALQLQEKENAAAFSRLAGEEHLMMFPAAPFNSTQYLMAAHSPAEDREKWLANSNSNSPQHDRVSPVPLTPVETNHETIHFPKRDKEFTDSFISAQAECLQSLPKEELVKHFMHLEEKVAALHKEVAQGEQQEQDDALCSKVCRRVNDPCVGLCDSVYNSETNSLSSNNEEFVDLFGVNQPPGSVGESSVFISETTTSPCNTNFSPVGSS
ncbi:hypothetical protein BsWGS_09547 [Bradybaena similaris]